MARPLASDAYRGGVNGGYSTGRSGHGDLRPSPDVLHELEDLRAENLQLRQLCGELEQALQEATAQAPDVSVYEERMREYDALLDEKSDTIRDLHQQLQDARDAADQPAPQTGGSRRQGPLPAEDELLALSEELEREKRQLQEDEASLMEQMRQMEMSMARERAEMARQRNDLQRLHSEIRHELERLERNGALQSKMEDLKTRLQDASNRRGAAPSQGGATPAQPTDTGDAPPPANGNGRGGSFMGRLFGK